MQFGSISLRNLLSFQKAAIELRPLNVLIGSNASGKSNLVGAISLLNGAPVSLSKAVLRGGGVRSWLRKGEKEAYPAANIEVATLGDGGQGRTSALAYSLSFTQDADGFAVTAEHLRDSQQIYFTRAAGRLTLGGGVAVEIGTGESVLSKAKSPQHTAIASIRESFERIRIYSHFDSSGNAPARTGVAANVPKEALEDGGSNLAMVLNEMCLNGSMDRVKTYMGRLYDPFEDVKVRLEAGIAQTYVHEKGVFEPIPALRLSDGTLKFLCLLAALFNPKAGPLVCIENPDIGLHPDALRLVADALIEASERMQLIVTTHSSELVDALSDRPDAVVVCERDFDNGTVFRRLDAARLAEWLERYRLGELWRKGEIGGGRW